MRPSTADNTKNSSMGMGTPKMKLSSLAVDKSGQLRGVDHTYEMPFFKIVWSKFIGASWPRENWETWAAQPGASIETSGGLNVLPKESGRPAIPQFSTRRNLEFARRKRDDGGLGQLPLARREVRHEHRDERAGRVRSRAFGSPEGVEGRGRVGHAPPGTPH
jgi:hypothetical protein